jgi:hypothetical protein
MLSKPVAASGMAPVADWYLLNASASMSLCHWLVHTSSQESLTSGDEDAGGSGVEITSCGTEDGRGTVLNGRIDTPVLTRWGGGRNGAVQFPVSVNILKLEGVRCLRPGDGISELSGISATERQHAILDQRLGCGFKIHGKEVGGDSPL